MHRDVDGVPYLLGWLSCLYGIPLSSNLNHVEIPSSWAILCVYFTIDNNLDVIRVGTWSASQRFTQSKSIQIWGLI